MLVKHVEGYPSEAWHAEELTILIVDDSPVIRQDIPQKLDCFSAKFLLANNGEQGLDFLKKEKVDIILLDLHMPVMSGFSFIEHTRVHFPYSALPILIMTSDTKPENLSNAFSIGANDFLTKPIQQQELQARVMNQLILLRQTREFVNKNRMLSHHLEEKQSEVCALSEELQAELVIKRSTQFQVTLYRRAIEYCPCSIVITDLKGYILSANDAANCQTDLHVGSLDPIFRMSSGRSRIELIIKALERSSCWSFEHQPNQNSGVWEKVEMTLLEEGAETYLLIIRNDITEQKENLNQLEEMLYTDSYTGLDNKIALQNYLLKLAATKQVGSRFQITAACIEIDGYYSMKEVHGHAFADELRKTVTTMLSTIFPDTKPFFVVSDHRCVVIDENNFKQSSRLNLEHTIAAAFAEPLVIQNKPIYITLSMGVATKSSKADDVDEVVRTAEMALNRAISSGHASTVWFDAAFELQSRRIIELEQALHLALKNNEFSLFFQPVMKNQGLELGYAECLIRWTHSDKGIISPAEFIPIAEKSGAIVQIGEWVAEEMCRYLSRWRHLKPNFYLAMNLSASQLKKNYDFHKFLTECLTQYDIPAHAVEIEVTEHMFLDEVDFNIATLDALKKSGFSLAIDDFGTGYSSLFYLSKFNFDKLKIDQHFIKSIVLNNKSEVIIGSIVNVARSLNMSITVEGVENEKILGGVAKFDIDYLQGYHFAKPMPGDTFEAEYIMKTN